jgi:ribosomal-protein-alanine N-acetyltransferase
MRVLPAGMDAAGRNLHARFPVRRAACTFVLPKKRPFGRRVHRENARLLHNPPIIETERVLLRMAALDDSPEIVRYFRENREHLADSRPTMGPEFFTEDFWRAQVHAAQSEFRTDRSLRLFLFEQAHPKRVIGNVNFVQFNRGAAQYCVLGYGLARDREGLGLMREGLQAAIGYVFRDLNMHRVMANYVPWNQRSGGLLRRLGFVVEGYARDYLFLNGQWRDHVLTSLTNPDWRDD